MELYQTLIDSALGSGGGGGGGSAKLGVLRGDAELVQKWTYDKLAVEDEGYTIPAYTTAQQTVKAGQSVSVSVADGYNYYLTARGIAYPVYSSTSVGKGRQEVFVYSASYEVVNIPQAEFEADNGTKANGNETSSTVYASKYYDLFWSGSSSLMASNNTISGASMSMSSNVYISNGMFNFSTPSLYLTGSSTQYNTTYWGYTTDIRYQYIIELYRVPTDADVRGFNYLSQLAQANNCWKSDSKTLT